jgi:ABC-2 type transport system permease protein
MCTRMFKLIRLFAAIFSVSLQREFAFRSNLLFQFLMTTIGIGSGVIALQVVYTQTTSLAGWSIGEAMLLLGTYQIVNGCLETFIEPNVRWFGGQIKSGKLDDILLKPISSIFLISLGSYAPLSLFQVLLGLVVVILGIIETGVVPTLFGIASWLVLLGIGLIVTWATRVLLTSLVLWAPSLELDIVYAALWQAGRYPVSIYRQPIRFALTYLFPVAFIATIPAQALTAGASPVSLLLGICIAVAAIVVVQLVWAKALKRYTSATS